jgi:hypothetical protein
MDYWIGSSIQSNPIIHQKSNFFGFSEFDLVGGSINHPIQNPEKN